MKRDFLQNFKVGEQPLPKEIIDAIMDENGRDIEAAKKPFEDYESLKEQLQTAKDGLAAFKDVDVDKLQGKITELTGQLADKDKQWQEKLDGMAFDGRIKDAITAAKGRNAKAIAALLDTDKLRASKNQEADIKTALLFLNHHSFTHSRGIRYFFIFGLTFAVESGIILSVESRVSSLLFSGDGLRASGTGLSAFFPTKHLFPA